MAMFMICIIFMYIHVYSTSCGILDPTRISYLRYDPENTEEAFANEKNGRMVFGVVLRDEDKRKFTEGMDFSDWAA